MRLTVFPMKMVRQNFRLTFLAARDVKRTIAINLFDGKTSQAGLTLDHLGHKISRICLQLDLFYGS